MKTKFKQTEVGLIPEDWLIKSIGEVSSVVGGGTPSTTIPHYWNGPIQWFTPSEISQRKYVDTSNRSITNEGLENSSARILPAGSILLTTRASIGETSILLIDATTNQGFQSLVVNSENSNEFLYYVLKTKKAELLKNASGSTFLEISPRKVKTIAIPLPPTLNEQRAIATALSDVDELIANLEKLIEKKKAIKQGAMQQLLTPPHKGGKRLQGFSGEWVESNLGVFCSLITKGTTPTSVGHNFTISGINFVKAESINSNGKLIKDKVAFIDENCHEALGRSKLKTGDILFTIAGVLGRIGIVTDIDLPANTNQAVAIIRLDRQKGVDASFIFHLLRSEQIFRHIESISVQGAQANFSLNDLANLPIQIPSSLEEQASIAELLTTLDNNILTLDGKLQKLNQLKRGMMQELLTGRTRLI